MVPVLNNSALISKDSQEAQKRPPLYDKGDLKWWWEPDSNQRTQREQIYSLRALATCISHLKEGENCRSLKPLAKTFFAKIMPIFTNTCPK